MTPHTVTVSNISSSTTESQLNDFFVLCGKIASIDYSEKEHKAAITFEKSNAVETALMLNGSDLDGATLNVTSDVAHQSEDRGGAKEDSYEQSDKPRAGIAAEYLAKGYVLSDQILQRAIEIDNKKGISKRFLMYFQSLDKSVGERTLGPDQTLSGKLQSTIDKATQQDKGYFKTAHDYYLKAITSPLGQKVRSFYTDTSKQVRDIHEEARRLADHEKSEKSSTTQQTQDAPAGSAPASAPESTPIN
ncbi:hypothetical protein BYT27DRAFT_7257512 [Phlegmacium glaucopus]|nr:hypothetical protein BYT27DRAFT_7257512 [Phlegmacium glaucopus]